MVQTPPRPTLLPYTTLFRSLLEAGDRLADLIRDAHRESEHLAQLTQLVQVSPPKLSQDGEIPARSVEEALRNLYDYAYLSDRKSTRLNSSHPSISYAVFCL